ncbi:hypothetical protein A9Q94_06725 [Rhodobacterales bacterium 56_14_T64]|nr:hypothetical protein A9Q94_06725 [Rhodobacterales bacterium 56_14_T64]
MGTLERLAEKLADDTMKVQDATGQDRLFMEISSVLAASSQTLEEAFLTEMRVRLAERIARKFLNKKIAEAQEKAEETKQA